MKSIVFENAALYDEIVYTDQLFAKAKLERKYLLRRLFEYLPMTESQVLQSTQALKALQNTYPGKIPQTILSPVQPGQDPSPDGMMKKKKSLSVSPLVKGSSMLSPRDGLSSSSQDEGASDRSSVKIKTKLKGIPMDESADESHKPKRKRPGTASRKKVQPIHLSEEGVPLFPITLGTLTVYDLGEIVHDRPGFHSERYLWPVGYRSSRLYPSMNDPDHRVQYYCAIKDGGSDPTFEVIPEDEPDKPITAVTATACHCIILKRLNKARGKDATNTGSGPEFFGFSHSTIQYLIQCLPGSEECEKFQSISFELPAAIQGEDGSDVLAENNLPRLDLLDRSTLELPQPLRKK